MTGLPLSRRVNDYLCAALIQAKDPTPNGCQTCLGKRVILQVSPAMHDAWATELTRATGTAVVDIRTYGEFRVQQLPHLREGTFQVRACWDCTELPTFPDDPEAIARFLT